jgi:hypothetical protein
MKAWTFAAMALGAVALLQVAPIQGQAPIQDPIQDPTLDPTPVRDLVR